MYALWEEVPKLVYYRLICKPVVMFLGLNTAFEILRGHRLPSWNPPTPKQSIVIETFKFFRHGSEHFSNMFSVLDCGQESFHHLAIILATVNQPVTCKFIITFYFLTTDIKTIFIFQVDSYLVQTNYQPVLNNQSGLNNISRES